MAVAVAVAEGRQGRAEIFARSLSQRTVPHLPTPHHMVVAVVVVSVGFPL